MTQEFLKIVQMSQSAINHQVLILRSKKKYSGHFRFVCVISLHFRVDEDD